MTREKAGGNSLSYAESKKIKWQTLRVNDCFSGLEKGTVLLTVLVLLYWFSDLLVLVLLVFMILVCYVQDLLALVFSYSCICYFCFSCS